MKKILIIVISLFFGTIFFAQSTQDRSKIIIDTFEGDGIRNAEESAYWKNLFSKSFKELGYNVFTSSSDEQDAEDYRLTGTVNNEPTLLELTVTKNGSSENVAEGKWIINMNDISGEVLVIAESLDYKIICTELDLLTRTPTFREEDIIVRYLKTLTDMMKILDSKIPFMQVDSSKISPVSPDEDTIVEDLKILVDMMKILDSKIKLMQADSSKTPSDFVTESTIMRELNTLMNIVENLNFNKLSGISEDSYALKNEQNLSENDFAYTLENEKATITDYTGSDEHVVIPKNLGGYEVTAIGYGAFEQNDSLTSVEIPDSVTIIGSWAFFDCDSLTSVKIANSVTSIESRAFSDCDSLTNIEIPDSVTSIGDRGFSDCDSLIMISFTSDHPVYVFDEGVLFDNSKNLLHTYLVSNKETSYVIPDFVRIIGSWAFENCNSLTSVEISDSVTSIEDWAFSGCDSVISVKIPDSITNIGDWVFNNCENLTNIKIPDSVTNIGNWTFNGCSSLAYIEIPNSVTNIETGAFSGCENLTLLLETTDSYAYSYAVENIIDCEFK